MVLSKRNCVCFLEDENFVATSFVILLFSVTANGAQQHSKSLTLKQYHLVRCLTHISHRYLAPGRSLVISSPATYRDVQHELISEIDRTAVCLVVVNVDGYNSTRNKTDFIDEDDSYMILIPDGNIEELRAEFVGLVSAQGTFKRLWNSDAKFVLAGANDFTMWQQMAIFKYFSRFRIYNCIIV
jgi:hypothetical protein